MKIKNLCLPILLGIVVAGCTSAVAANYNVELELTPAENGTKAYITDYDSGAKIDSVIVENNKAVFVGNIDNPVMARIIVDGQRASQLILEPGSITCELKGFASGTPLNDKMGDILNSMNALVAEYNALPDLPESEERAKQIIAEYDAMPAAVYKQNLDNPIGYFFFIQTAYDMNLAELQEAMKNYPQWANTDKIKGLETSLMIEAETSEGHHYKDFTIEFDGKIQKLSDYVCKNGNYTLVDFWASWCGPCMKEIATIKKLYEKYNGKGLDVVGVAVWDEPANSLATIQNRQLPWNQIINGQTIPTDLYGISGIPCILLIDPNGIIVSRGKQGENLVADVEKYLENWTPAETPAE